MYKLIYDKLSNINFIKRLADDCNIPPIDTCSEYQEYLQWLAEGNEPEPPDEPQQEEPPAT